MADRPDDARVTARAPVAGRGALAEFVRATRRDVQRARLLPWASTLARLVLGGVWIAAGVAKITDPDASIRAVRAYQLLPEPVVQIVGPGLPPAEILLGALLVLGAGVRVSAVISTVLMSAFVIGIASAWVRGLRIDCGCFGSGGILAAGQRPTYGWELTRDAGLLVLALFLVRWPPGRWALDAVLAPQGRSSGNDLVESARSRSVPRRSPSEKDS